MSYNLDWALGTTKTSIKIAAGEKDDTTTSLSLYGKGSPNYGEGIQENLIRMLENWAAPTPPPHPTRGQLWYNTANDTLHVFNGTTFIDASAQIDVAIEDYLNQTVSKIIEIDSRVNEVVQHVTENAEAIVKETQDRVISTAAETLARNAAIIAEAKARTDAITSGLLAESSARTADLLAESAARQKAIADGLLAEALQRQSDISTERQTRQTAIDSFSQQLTTITASLGDVASALQIEQNARSTEDGAITQQITTIAARMDTAEASIVEEATTRVSAIETLASLITNLTTTTNQNTAAISAEQTTRTDADTAIATQVTNLLSANDSLTAAIQTEQTTRTTQVDALASTLSTVTSSIDANSALISVEQQARVDADHALSERIDTVFSKTAENTAAIQTEQSTRTDAISSLATRIDNIVASSGGDATAAIDSEAQARATADTALGSRIDTVVAVANAKNRTYSQSTPPSSPVVGDLWIDTANNNQMKRWNGTIWAASDDSRIAQNQAAIAAEQKARADADSAQASLITSVTAIAGAKNQSFKQSTAPTATSVGDLWIDTGNNNIIKRWDGSTWVASDDLRIGQALTLGSNAQAAITTEQQARADADTALGTRIDSVTAAAALKNRTFSQPTAPTATATGDIWIDTANSNQMKRWNGSAWVAADDTRLAANVAAITTEQKARADADTALGTRIDSVTAANQSNATAITTEQTARVTADNALGTRIDSVSTKTDANIVAITTEIQARTDADSALGSRIDALVTTTGTNTAAITAEQKARADADTAFATTISTVSATANAKNRTFSQATAPNAQAVGDLWIDTANGNLLKRWNGSAWVAADDTRIATVSAAITAEQKARADGDTAVAQTVNTVSAVANSKTTTFSQSTTPSATAVGDLWVDTGNGNQLKRWSGTAWVAVDDTRIASAMSAITSEQQARIQGDNANAQTLTNLTTTVNTKTTTFRQSATPTASAAGDTWVDTGNGNLLKIWTGTAWVTADDARIASLATTVAKHTADISTEQQARADGDSANATAINTVSATAASKNRTFYQSTAPSAYAVGDLWIDTANNNILKRWNGSAWVTADDARLTTLNASITAEQQARVSGDTALSQKIDTLSANTVFDTAPGTFWTFDDKTVQNWSTANATLAVDSLGSTVTISSTTGNPALISPSITLVGSSYSLVRMRIRRIAGTGWQGDLYYSVNAGHGYLESYKKNIPDPGLGLNSNWVTLEWDMTALTAGGADWTSNTITGIRFDLGASVADKFQIDWIGIGRNSPSASRADITTEQTARIQGDQSLASSISTLSSTVNGHTTSIQTTQTTVNGIAAQYSVKIDNNGYVTGYGLMSAPVNGVPTSAFNIVADRFSLTKPTLNGGQPVVPFSIDTTTTPATIILDGLVQLRNTNIAAGAVTPNKMAVTMLSAISSNIGTITAGTMSAGTVFAGALSAATGTFAGSLQAATGTFSGALNAATGTFSGDISAANGTFSGTLRANIVDTSQLIQGSVSNVDFFSYNNYSNTAANISVTPQLTVPADSLVMFFAQETHSGQSNMAAVTGYWTVQGLANTANLVTLNANGGAAGRYLTAGTYNLKGVLSCAGGQGYIELSAVKIKR